MQCDAILQQGIFNSILIDTSRDVSENLFNWLSTSSFSDVNSKINSGLKIALPIDGVPLDFGATFTQDKFNQWKNQVSQGQARAFTQQEMMKLISSNVDQGIVNAWVECVKANSTQGQSGLLAWFDGPSDGNVIVFTTRYLPTSITDYPPVVSPSGFQISGGLTSYPLADGREIPLAGVSCLIQRQGDNPVTVVLNTTKGTATLTAALPPIQQSDLQLTVHRTDVADGRQFTMQMSGISRAIAAIQRVDYKANGFLNVIGPHDGDPFTRSFSSTASSNHFQVVFTERNPILEIIAIVSMASGQVWQFSWNVLSPSGPAGLMSLEQVKDSTAKELESLRRSYKH